MRAQRKLALEKIIRPNIDHHLLASMPHQIQIFLRTRFYVSEILTNLPNPNWKELSNNPIIPRSHKSKLAALRNKLHILADNWQSLNTIMKLIDKELIDNQKGLIIYLREVQITINGLIDSINFDFLVLSNSLNVVRIQMDINGSKESYELSLSRISNNLEKLYLLMEEHSNLFEQASQSIATRKAA
jgi:hypothetical protein